MGLYFHKPEQGWAVGSGGTILKTVDGGKKWKKMVSGTTASLSAVFFFDEKQGWAVGANGTILRSQDGGNTWHQQLVETQVPFYGISFVSASEGWVEVVMERFCIRRMAEPTGLIKRARRARLSMAYNF